MISIKKIEDHQNSVEYIAFARSLGGTINFKGNSTFSLKLYQWVYSSFDLYKSKYKKRHRNYYDFLESIEVGFIASKIPNAFAWKRNASYCIGITSGLVHYMFYTISYLMSSRGALAHLYGGQFETGDPPKDVRLDLEDVFVNEDDQAIAYKVGRTPISQDRMNAVMIAVSYSCLFALLHEIGHIFNKHLDVIKDLYNVEMMSELGMHEIDVLEQDARHFFEMQADQFAIDSMLKFGVIQNKLASFKDVSGKRAAYYIWSFSIELMFLLFSQRKENIGSTGSHPHPMSRSYAKVAAVSTFFGPKLLSRHKQDRSLTSEESAIHLATHELSAFWRENKLPGSKFIWIGDSEVSLHYGLYFNKLLKNVSDIRKIQGSYLDLDLYSKIFPHRVI